MSVKTKYVKQFCHICKTKTRQRPVNPEQENPELFFCSVCKAQTMQYITPEVSEKLKAQWRICGETEVSEAHLKVWVKIFDPCGGSTWYICEQNPAHPDELYGLCCIHEPEWGYVSLAELQGVKGPLGIGLERDLYFEPITIKEFKAQIKAGELP